MAILHKQTYIVSFENNTFVIIAEYKNGLRFECKCNDARPLNTSPKLSQEWTFVFSCVRKKLRIATIKC